MAKIDNKHYIVLITGMKNREDIIRALVNNVFVAFVIVNLNISFFLILYTQLTSTVDKRSRNSEFIITSFHKIIGSKSSYQIG